MSSNMLMSCRLIMEGLLNGPPGAQVQSLCLKRCLTFLVAINQVIKKTPQRIIKETQNYHKRMEKKPQVFLLCRRGGGPFTRGPQTPYNPSVCDEQIYEHTERLCRVYCITHHRQKKHLQTVSLVNFQCFYHSFRV